MPRLLTIFALLALSAPAAAQPFEVVPSPNVGVGSNALYGVDGRAADDVWAAGFYHDPSQGADRTLMLHWNGDVWEVDPTPNPSSGYNRLHDVATPPNGTVWAVGSREVGSALHPMVLRRQAGIWEEAGPAFAAPGVLQAVHDMADDDIWAVGATLRTDGFPDDGLAFHYNGTAWTQTPLPAVDNLHTVVAVDASSQDNVWAVGSSRATIFGGASPLAYRWNGAAWAVIPIPLPDVSLTAVAVRALHDVWVTGTNASGSGAMAHWDGTGWTAFTSQGAAPVPSVALADDGTPYAASHGEVYRYDAGAGRWNEMLGTFSGQFFDVAAGPGGHVWAGSGGVYGSLDGGQTWSWAPIHTAPHSGTPASIFTVAVGPDETVYAWAWRSVDNGASWQTMGRGLLATTFTGAAVYAGTFEGVYRSTTSGASWSPSGLAGMEVGAIASTGTGFVAATPDGLWHSADGAAWTATASLPGVAALAATLDGEFWAAAPDGLYRSGDGASWPSSPAAFAGEPIADVVARGTTILATVEGVPHRSTDAGATWTALTEGLNTTGGAPFSGMNALLALAPDDVFAFGERIAHWDGMTWRESDLGGLSDPLLASAVVLPDSTVWVVGRVVEGGVQRTLTVRRPRVPVAVETADLEDGFALSPARPNPVRGSAQLTLTMPEAQDVTVAVYDALGRRVAMLQKGMVAAGAHAIMLDASALSPGVYVVRASAGARAVATRLVVR